MANALRTGVDKTLQREERRQRILEAAIDVFGEKGYRKTSIADIIRHAEINRGTFYLYFDSKKEVFLEVVEYFLLLLNDALRNLPDTVVTQDNLRSVLADQVRSILGFYRANRRLVSIVFREAESVDERFHEKMDLAMKDTNTMLRRGLSRLTLQGHLRRFDLDLFTTLLSGMLREIAVQRILPDRNANIEHIVNEFVDFELRGMVRH